MTDFQTTFELEENVEGFDIHFNEDGKLQMVTGTDKAQQDIKVLFKTQVGEDMFHREWGFDFLSVINSSSEDMVKLMIMQALYRYKYLSKIESVVVDSWNYATRRITVTVKIGIASVPISVELEVI